MSDATTRGLRRILVATLIIALTLAGLGRTLAAAAQPAPFDGVIAGVHAPICHSDADGAPADPSRPVSHDCCDGCALLAPAVLPAPPAVAGPAPVEHYAGHARAVAWSPVLARQRNPRLSRGPPAA